VCSLLACSWRRTKACCARDRALGRKAAAVSAASVFGGSVAHASKKFGMNWEVWKGGEVAMKKE